MGVLNVTPDSFYDGGRYLDHDLAIQRGMAMIAEGADIIDVGGESSRPGAQSVPADEECRRILPVVNALAREVRVSVDTVKPEVARAAVGEGATLLNDVGASLAPLAAELGVGIALMHMLGTPKTMQHSPHYDDVVDEVTSYLLDVATRAKSLGVDEVYVDPGIGFGKRLEDNVALLQALPRLVDAGFPVMVGTSRKSFLGTLSKESGAPVLGPEERLEGSLATAVWSMACGASMVRVHDVAATAMAASLLGASPSPHIEETQHIDGIQQIDGMQSGSVR
jgi:dihydropteroate synthase